MASESSAARNRGMISMDMTLAAGVPQRIALSGDYFHVLTAPVNDMTVRFDDGKKTPARQGVGFRVYYDAVELESATGQAITVLVGFGSVQDGRSSAVVSATVNIAPGATINDGGDVSCPNGGATLLLAADANRLYALIANNSSNTITVRIGTAGVGAATGTPLEPGQTLPLATTAAIYAYNGGGSAVTISASSVKV